MDIITYFDRINTSDNIREIYFLYLNNYSKFKNWAKEKNIDLTLPYIDDEYGKLNDSALLLWIEDMEAY